MVVVVRNNPCRPVPEETFTRSHPSRPTHLPHHLSPPATVHGILPTQPTCLTVPSNNPPGPPGPEPPTPHSTHPLTQSSPSPRSTRPHQRSLLCHNTNAMSFTPSFPPSSPPGIVPFSPTPHIHPTTPIPARRSATTPSLPTAKQPLRDVYVHRCKNSRQNSLWY